MPHQPADQPVPPRGILVTGASRGIGAATAAAFAARGDRVAVASRGIGAATAAAFAARGDRVAVHYRGARERAEQVLAGLPGDGHLLVQGDLADPAQARAVAEQAVAGLGRVDVLVNNAARFLNPKGEGSRRGDHRVTEVGYEAWVEAWQQTLATNLMGPANLTWCLARHMIEVPAAEGLPAGRVVNVGSRGAYRGEPAVPAYGASKAGLHAFGQSMAVALAPHGIGVVTLAPGFVATEMAAAVLEGPEGESVRSQSPYGRVATAEEVAGALLRLADPALEWASGGVVDFNGASHLR